MKIFKINFINITKWINLITSNKRIDKKEGYGFLHQLLAIGENLQIIFMVLLNLDLKL